MDSSRPTPQEPTGTHGGPAFTLRWTYERADLRDAVMGQPAFKRQRRIGRRLLLGAVVACALLAFRPGWSNGALLAALLFGALMVEVAPRLAAWQQWRANPQLHGEAEATVSATGVRAQIPGAETDYGWEVFRQVHETRRALLLAFSAKSAGPVLMLPKRALTPPGDVAALRDLVHRMIGGSATSTPGTRA